MLRQEELAFRKALSLAQPSPALLKELRKAVASARKKKWPTVPTRSRSTTIGGASTASHRTSTKVAGNAMPTSWPGWATLRSPQYGAQHPAMGPHHCPQYLQVLPANKPPPAAGNSGPPRAGRQCGGSSRACRPAQAKWAAQAHSQGIGSLRTRSLLRDSTRAHVY